MDYILEGLTGALRLIISLDPEMAAITLVSLKVSTAAILIAVAAGLPLGFFAALRTFPGKRYLIIFLNTILFIPSVLAGLLIYSFISRRGPLGGLEILYTPAAMILGQAVLAFPIIASLTLSAAQAVDKRVEKTALALGADSFQKSIMIFTEGRFAIFAGIITGFSKVFAEVGASMMLGGNIRGYTRNITTAIALETGKGEFVLGIALGIIMLAIALLMNILLQYFQGRTRNMKEV